MKIKKFVASNLPEALARIKQDMGESAVILKTRFNWAGASSSAKLSFVEVTAAIDQAAVIPPIVAEPVEEKQIVRPQVDRIRSAPEPSAYSEAEPIPAPMIQTSGEIISDIKKDIASLRESFERSQSLFGQPAGMQIEVARKLVEKSLPENLAIEIAKKLSLPHGGYRDSREIWDEVKGHLAAILSPGEPIRPYDDKAAIILLAGPTGSGKTSAAARLAFSHSIEKNIPVALFSTDTNNSQEQLRSLAETIGCPFLSIASPEQMAAALGSCRKGLAIVDTCGISSEKDIAELVPIIGIANPHEIHLVVPADIPARDLRAILKSNPDFRVNKILVTKLDQSHCRGGILGAAYESGLEFSYQTASRDLPGRFGIFKPEPFVQAFMPDPEKSQSDAIEVIGW